MAKKPCLIRGLIPQEPQAAQRQSSGWQAGLHSSLHMCMHMLMRRRADAPTRICSAQRAIRSVDACVKPCGELVVRL